MTQILNSLMTQILNNNELSKEIHNLFTNIRNNGVKA
jgi:hypothetical protein